jgi:outer membrane protein TolC
MMKRVLAVCFAALALPAPVFSQPRDSGASVTLTVDEAVRRGLEASHRLAEAAARRDAAVAVAGQQHAAGLPQLTGQAGYTRTNHVDEFGIPISNNIFQIIYPDVPDNYLARLDVRWPIYTGGRIEATEQAARIEANAHTEDLEAMRGDVRLEIVRAFWSLTTAVESIRVVQDSLLLARAHLTDARNQLDAGVVGPSDVLAIEAQESRYRMLLVQAEVARDVAEAELARLIGVTPGTRIEPIGDEAVPPPQETDGEALVAVAERQRSDRAALVERVTAAEARLTAAGANAKPTITVNGGYDYARPNPNIFPRQAAWRGSWQAGLIAAWPLFDGGRTDELVNEAGAAARAAQARLAEFDSVLAVEVRQRVRELEAGRAAIVAADDALRAATEARRVAGERFNAGVATSTDVLVAQTGVLQAGLDRTQALANVRLAEARLVRALGSQP